MHRRVATADVAAASPVRVSAGNRKLLRRQFAFHRSGARLGSEREEIEWEAGERTGTVDFYLVHLAVVVYYFISH